MRYDIHPTSLEEYMNQKVKMLKKDFKIRLTAKETNYLQSLPTEIAVDNYIRTIIKNKL